MKLIYFRLTRNKDKTKQRNPEVIKADSNPYLNKANKITTKIMTINNSKNSPLVVELMKSVTPTTFVRLYNGVMLYNVIITPSDF
jgi:hypothetical protein